jgi:hypothetical protein
MSGSCRERVITDFIPDTQFICVEGALTCRKTLVNPAKFVQVR